MKNVMVATLVCVVLTAEVTGRLHTAAREQYKKLKDYWNYLRRIHSHNERYKSGRESYEVRENVDADLNFVSTMDGVSGSARQAVDPSDDTFRPPDVAALPREVDWRRAGAVTRVKNQGSCQSCWAFTAIGAIEGQIFKATEKLISLSAQNLLDCTYDHGNHGCLGGWMNNAFRYVRDNGGVDKDVFYGYHAEETGCSYTVDRSGARVTGVVNIPAGDEELLAAAVATVGPVAAAVDASQFGFRMYSHGVYYDRACSGRNLNHAVLVVGYGTDPRGGDYWLVKNSWGERWGEGGYMKLARNRENHCGIAAAASFPKVVIGSG